MTTETKFKHECSPRNARQFWHWIKTRGGIYNWTSINLGNCGASWSTPALDKEGKPYTKPNWQCSNTPTHFQDPEEIGVFESEVFKIIPVTLKGRDLAFYLSDASQRNLDKWMDKCEEKHGNSFYERGGLDERPSMTIRYTTEMVPLSEWINKNGAGQPEEWE